MDRGILVTIGRTGRIPSLLVKNWKISHGCDPVAAARKSLAFEKSSRWKALSAIIGAVIFLATVFFLGIVMPSTGSGGKISAEWLLPFLGGMFIWLLAHVVAMEIEGHFGLRAIENEFREEACVFGGYLEELSVAAGTPSWSALANMDLKALAEKLLVDRAEQVLQAEEKSNKWSLDISLAHEKFNCANAFASLFDTLKELGLVSGDFGPFYEQAQKIREQEFDEECAAS